MDSSLATLEARAQETESWRLATSTVKSYRAEVKNFRDFCMDHVARDPTVERFPGLPRLVTLFLQATSERVKAYNSVNNTKSGLVWLYEHGPMKEPETRVWSVKEVSPGVLVASGNPVHTKDVVTFMASLRKKKKRTHTPLSALPITLPMLAQLHAYLDSDEGRTCVNRDTALWFKAVSSTAFYLMARMGEIFDIRRRDIAFGGYHEGAAHGSIKLMYRKTEESSGRQYHLYFQDDDQRPIDCMYHVLAWLEHMRQVHNYDPPADAPLFPCLRNVGRHGGLTSIASAGLDFGRPMSESAMGTLLNKIINLTIISPRTTEVHRNMWAGTKYSCHTFRRAGAQHRFMLAGPGKCWPLSQVKWWAGWCKGILFQLPYCMYLSMD